MDKATKIIIGGVITSCLAWGAHSGLGNGDAFVDRLESRATATLSEQKIAGVDIAMQREPTISRDITLSGDETQKDAAMAAVSKIDGVGNVKWAGDDANAADANAIAEEPATQEAVTECQGDINTLMEGKAINFRSGSAYIGTDSNVVIAELAAALKPCAGTLVEVQGHTDLTGSSEVNTNISQARADSVKAALIKAGVPAERLTSKGYGSSQPIENARTSAANATNRRTAFIVSATGNQSEGE